MVVPDGDTAGFAGARPQPSPGALRRHPDPQAGRLIGQLAGYGGRLFLVAFDGRVWALRHDRWRFLPPLGRPPENLWPVLEQLMTGATDRAASHRLGLSGRTYSRRVADLLDHLGVATRFQAGVEVGMRGWLRGGQAGRLALSSRRAAPKEPA